MHQCPVCRSPVETRPAYRRYSGRLGYFPANQGIRCTTCNTILKVDARNSIILNIVTMVVLFAAIVSIDQALPGAPILLSVMVAIGLVAWITTKAHGFLTLSAPHIGDELLSDDECWPDRVGEDYIPTEEELIEIEIEVGVPGDAAGVDWTCSSCGEENTREFALCWKCGGGFTPKDA